MTSTEILDSVQPKGQVVAESPVAGTSLTAGATVALSVSKGQTLKQIPDVTGNSQADAEALLKSIGFTSTVVTQNVTDPSQDGIVQSQNPVGGTEGKPGALVTLTVGKLLPQTTTSTTTTTTTTPTTTTTTTTPAPPVPPG